MRMRDETLAHETLQDALGGAPAPPREAHVILFNARREILLQRIDVAGLPHAATWTAAVMAPVPAGSGYEATGARALAREMGLRTPLRFVGATWIDAPGGRRFVGVLVGFLEGHAPEPRGRRFVPIDRLAAAARRGGPDLDPAFLRAWRLIVDDDTL